MNKVYLILIIALMIGACKKQKEIDSTNQEVFVVNNQMDSVVKRNKIKPLDTSISDKLKVWSAYQKLYNILIKFQKISPKEAMSYATEIKLFSNQLTDNDSVQISFLNDKSFKTRLNVLRNEVYRFEDMSNISSISAKEVNSQIDKIFEVFSSLNTKISSEYKKNNIRENVFKRDSLLNLE